MHSIERGTGLFLCLCCCSNWGNALLKSEEVKAIERNTLDISRKPVKDRTKPTPTTKMLQQRSRINKQNPFQSRFQKSQTQTRLTRAGSSQLQSRAGYSDRQAVSPIHLASVKANPKGHNNLGCRNLDKLSLPSWNSGAGVLGVPVSPYMVL